MRSTLLALCLLFSHQVLAYQCADLSRAEVRELVCGLLEDKAAVEQFRHECQLEGQTLSKVAGEIHDRLEKQRYEDSNYWDYGIQMSTLANNFAIKASKATGVLTEINLLQIDILLGKEVCSTYN